MFFFYIKLEHLEFYTHDRATFAKDIQFSFAFFSFCWVLNYLLPHVSSSESHLKKTTHFQIFLLPHYRWAKYFFSTASFFLRGYGRRYIAESIKITIYMMPFHAANVIYYCNFHTAARPLLRVTNPMRKTAVNTVTLGNNCSRSLSLQARPGNCSR